MKEYNYTDLSVAALKANVDTCRARRDRYVNLALEALGEEQKWAHALKVKENPEGALNDLLVK